MSSIEYGPLMHQAMRRLIHSVLTQVQDNGLPGDHHFYITFATTHSRVQMADWLLERYPEEITVVVQEWFDNLVVDDQGFSITLNFGDSPEPLYIPFDALVTFVDPSVEFGLRFEPVDDAPEPEPEPEPPTQGDGQVVSLAQFRKQ